MKTKIIAFILMIFMIFTLTSCDAILDSLLGGNGTDDPPIDDDPPIEGDETIYDVLTRLTKEKYIKIVIDVSTTTNGVELKSKYSLANRMVQYEIEQLNKLPEDGNFEGTSSSFKSKISGTAEIMNGQVVKLDGTSVSLPTYDQLKGGFDFSRSNFKNADPSTQGVFKADVVSPSKFLGVNTDAQNMKVVVEYNSTSLKTITINYKTDNSIVKISYKFTK